MLFDPLLEAALAASALLLFTLLAMRARPRPGTKRRPARQDAMDTVAGWPPEATRVLTAPEAQAHDVLRQAASGFVVLGQVPLSRFIRVPTRYSYSDWLARVGSLNVDLLVCDRQSRVITVVEVRPAQESERSLRRHERMVRVLTAAGISVHVWPAERLPTVADAKAQLGDELARHAAPGQAAFTARPTTSRPMPLFELPEITEVLAEGDAAAAHADLLEPVPSGYFDDLDVALAAPARR
jgi:Protein of unknown function (DUF2726)